MLALDYETTGLDIVGGADIVGVGLSDGVHSLYIPLLDATGDGPFHLIPELHKWLNNKQLIGHNICFDGLVYKRSAARHADWIMDTYAMFKYLATENWVGQSWSLKTAMVDVLGWPEDNQAELTTWLKANKLKKGSMWKAPAAILGRYCALDAGATYHLYEYFLSFESQFPALFDYHRNEGIGLAKSAIDQEFRGLGLNIEGLERYAEKLRHDIDATEREFLTHPQVSPLIDQFNALQYNDYLHREPTKFKKDGSLTKHWMNWSAKVSMIRSTNFFSITSKHHLVWLIYNNLYKVQYGTVVVDNEAIQVKLTPGGRPSVDKNMLPYFGEIGQLLLRYNDMSKELTYVKSCLELQKNGRLHMPLKVPGTVTGRCGGGSLGARS